MDKKITNKSVQVKPEFEEGPRSNLVVQLASIADDIPAWGNNPHYRDIELRKFWPTEPYLASAIYTIVARNSAFNWTLDGPPRTVKIVQDMLHNADLGRGWLSFITKLSLDLFTQDNGAFIEIIRDGLSDTSPVIGIANLDSVRCRRTGVPDWPVIYLDRYGQEHKMRPWQIISVEEFPSPIETMNNVQYCAVTRILRMAQLLRDISVYKREKVIGHTKAIDIISGIRTKEIEDALKTHNEEQLTQGYIRYFKPLIFGTLDPNAAVKHERIDLSSLPDGFNEEVTMKWYISLLAMGFGADFQDFAPLPGGGLGSSQQSQILHQKSRGKGPALFMKTIEHKFNFHGIIPQNMTFRYNEQDIAGDMEQAMLEKTHAETSNIYIMNGTLTSEAVRQQMLDRGELTQEEFDNLQIEPDVTPDITANDTDPIDNESKAVKRPAFMDRERLKVETDFQADIQKALSTSLIEFKKRILGKKFTKEYLPFAEDIINDEEMWENFRVRVIGAAQPYFRNGALQAAAYNARLGLAVNMDWVNSAVLDFTRTYANNWWMELSKVTRDGLRKAILAWQEIGLGEQGLQDLVNAITPLFGEDRARRIAITETTRIFDEGNKLAHISAGIKYEQWQTAEDDLVCTICGPLNGQYFLTESGPRPVTDTHPNCRCMREPAANYNPVE